MIKFKDVTLELDDFDRNKVITGISAAAQQFYMLLIMEPGDCADQPEKGIALYKYRIGISDNTISDLKSSIEEQVELYCDFYISELEVVYKNGEVVVGIKIPSENEIILFRTSADNNVLLSIINT